MGVFDRSIATAQRLIAKFGQDCEWQQQTPEDGGTPGYPGDGVVPDPIPCKIAWFAPRDLGRGTEVFAALMAGIEVSSSNEIGLLAGGLTFEPDDADTIIRGTERLAIKQIDRLASNGTPVIYYVQVAA